MIVPTPIPQHPNTRNTSTPSHPNTSPTDNSSPAPLTLSPKPEGAHPLDPTPTLAQLLPSCVDAWPASQPFSSHHNPAELSAASGHNLPPDADADAGAAADRPFWLSSLLLLSPHAAAGYAQLQAAEQARARERRDQATTHEPHAFGVEATTHEPHAFGMPAADGSSPIPTISGGSSAISAISDGSSSISTGTSAQARLSSLPTTSLLNVRLASVDGPCPTCLCHS